MSNNATILFFGLTALLLAQPAVNPNAAVVKDFEQRVTAYVKLRKECAKGLPALKPRSSPELLTKHQAELAARIRARRINTTQGEFFTAPIRAEFQQLIAKTMAGADGAKVREALKTDEPATLKLRVNDSYPSSAPLQTAPPTLLMNLPKLPPELEYRVVSNNLMLRDVDANLILDYMTNVIR